MRIAPIYVPQPAYSDPVELLVLDRVRHKGVELVEQYLTTYTSQGCCLVGRDAAKMLFPEYLADRTANNRFVDGAASAIADAARRSLLARPAGQDRNRVFILTGAPASGKTGSAGPRHVDTVEMLHETILTSLAKSSELIEQVLNAGRSPILHLFYTDDPRIHVTRMVDRALRIGRTIPLQYLAKTYITVPVLVGHLQAQFGARLPVLVSNNSEAPSLVVHHNRLERAIYHLSRYTEESALEAMHAELDAIVRDQSIPEAIIREARSVRGTV